MDSTESRTREATAGISDGEDTQKREKLVDCGSNSDHRCGDCYGHSAEIADGVSVHHLLHEGFLLLLGWHTLFVSFTHQLCKNETLNNETPF